MWKVLLCAGVAISLIAVARGCYAQAQAPTYALQLTDQQIDGIIAGAAQCENRTQFACAELVIYLRNLMTEVRRPKETKKE